MFALAEGKRVDPSAWPEERDLESTVGYGARLAAGVVQWLFGQGSVGFVADIGPVRRPRWLPRDTQMKRRGGARCGGAHDEVEVAGVEPVGDLTLGLVEGDNLFLHGPVPGQGPVIESQLRWGGVHARLAGQGAPGRREGLGALVAGVGFR